MVHVIFNNLGSVIAQLEPTMPDNKVSWPFDPTGTKPDNKVTNELQVISPPNSSEYYFLIPNAAPYYKDSMKLFFREANGARRPMIHGVDWLATHFFIGASRSTAKPVYGSITILNKQLAGVIELAEYQCVGGDWTVDSQKAIEIVANALGNPRITTWEEVDDRPTRFPPTDHEWYLDDLVGMKETVEVLEKVVDAIYARQSDEFSQHLGNRNNPHQVTKAQVGLGLVENFAISTRPQAEQGTVEDRYMTPLRVKQAINFQIRTDFDAFVARRNNPHAVTKTQIGLGLVENYATADNAKTLAGTAFDLYVTPAGLKHTITQGVGQDLLNHVTDLDNPHKVTKEQVGLGQVQNYPPATNQEAAAAALTTRYLTPASGKALVQAVAGTMLDEHITDYTNPHRVTRAQIGLALVENYAVPSEQEARDGILNTRYMTPLRTSQAIQEQAGKLLQKHIDDKTNPHAVSKAQVGLGSVENYAIATSPEAIQGTVNVKYMTPLRTKEAIDNFKTTVFDPFVALRNNPHAVTAAQVGAYTIAQTDAVASAAESRAKAYTDAHSGRRDNPHGVTKGQLGLGSVEDYKQVRNNSGNQIYLSWNGAEIVAQVDGSVFGRIHTFSQPDPNIALHRGDTNNPHQTNKWHVGLGSLNDWPAASAWDIGNGTGGRYVPADALRAYLISLGIGDGSGNMENLPNGQRGFARIGPVLVCFGWVNSSQNNIFTGFMRQFNGRPSVVAQAHDVTNGSPSRSLQTVDGVGATGFRFRWDGIGVQGWSYVAFGIAA